MPPLRSAVVLAAVVCCVAGGCQEGRLDENYCELQVSEVKATAKLCDCPWQECAKEAGVYKCRDTHMDIYVGVTVLCVITLGVLLGAWVCCCKGKGCACTALCRGGVCCGHARLLVTPAPIEHDQVQHVAVEPHVVTMAPVSVRQHPLRPTQGVPILGTPQELPEVV
eukprot:TRINITY_DN5961_c0_g2_i1.p1 TRINITY_DN5961_c0_g2~~TRINITY_DN5961_c0_g2_i1.p1  ORF type:complete len:167 (+),score=21.96 TRINITY_DN5961_c0_g2_i1:110-610(+)